jgi:carboxylate-amine ligase
MSLRSVGVEEELLLVDPATGRPRAVAGTALQAVRQADPGQGHGPEAETGGPDAAEVLELELQLQQLETNTQPCRARQQTPQHHRDGRSVRPCPDRLQPSPQPRSPRRYPADARSARPRTT